VSTDAEDVADLHHHDVHEQQQQQQQPSLADSTMLDSVNVTASSQSIGASACHLFVRRPSSDSCHVMAPYKLSYYYYYYYYYITVLQLVYVRFAEVSLELSIYTVFQKKVHP